MALTDTATNVARAASNIQTVGQGRAALGVISVVCRRAYERAEDATGAGGVDDAARSRIDVVNRYAQRLYDVLPTGNPQQTDALSPLMASQIGLALGQAQRAFADVEEAIRETAWDFVALLTEAIVNAARYAGGAIQAATNSVAGGAFAFIRAAWPTLLVVGGVLVALLWLRGGGWRKIVGGKT